MGNNDDIETKRTLPQNAIAGALWTIFGKSGHLRVLTKTLEGSKTKLPAALRFDGFPPSDFDRLTEAFQTMYGITLKRHSMSSAGASWGNTDIANKHLVFRQCMLEDADEDGEEFEPRDGEEMLSLDLGEVSQCVLPGNNRNEIEMQFLESDTVEAGTDQLVAIRFYVPPDQDADPTDKDAPTSAELLQSRITEVASVKKTSGAIIAEFDENKGTFLTPRGRYSIELYDSFLRLRGAKYDYKIKYDDISRLFLLPKQDDMHMAFVIALDKPIRQGQQCTKEQSELNINLDDATIEKEYNGEIQAHMNGSFSNLVAKTFKVITKKKVFIPGKFANANQQACVKCALRANEGHLYPLEKQFIFIHKPAVLIRFDEIESVEFQRYAGGQGSTRNFDLSVSLINTPGDNLAVKEYTFSGIDKTNYASLYSFLSQKKIRIKNIEGIGSEEPARSAPMYNEMDEGGEEMGESSEDEDYDQAKASESEESSSDEDDDDDLGSMSDDSDLAEHRKKAAKKSKDKSSKKEKPSKKSADKGSNKRKEPEKKKKQKDPNAPKRGLSAFNFFTSAKRGDIKAANPDASFAELAKLVGAEFKGLSASEKAKYEELAANDKKRYEKEMESYVPPEEDSDDESDGEKTTKKPSAKKAKKDPNAPKVRALCLSTCMLSDVLTGLTYCHVANHLFPQRPMNPYMLFANSVRAQVREENPDMSMGDVSKEIGIRYNAIDEEEKAKWQSKADAAKEVYKKEMAQYEKTKPQTEKSPSKPKTKAKDTVVKKVTKPEPKSESEDSDDDAAADSSDDSGSYASESD
eukprot:scaffold15735_cov193-Alexandrium_tamarense.AAC.2